MAYIAIEIHGPLFDGAMHPCPFCGGDAVQGEGYGSSETKETVYVRCAKCNASGPEKAKHVTAAKAWNRRKVIECPK